MLNDDLSIRHHPKAFDVRSSLEARFRLARRLTSTVSNFHNAGWSHKYISSLAVAFLFFDRGKVSALWNQSSAIIYGWLQP